MGYLIAAAGGVISLLVAFFLGNKLGKKSEKLETTEQILDNVATAKKLKSRPKDEILNSKGSRE